MKCIFIIKLSEQNINNLGLFVGTCSSDCSQMFKILQKKSGLYPLRSEQGPFVANSPCDWDPLNLGQMAETEEHRLLSPTIAIARL